MIQHLSYSSISSYQDCSAAWKFKYIDKIPTASSPALLFGSAWHGTVENYLTNKANNQPIDLLQCWNNNWKIQLEKNPSVSWGVESPEIHQNVGIKWLSGAVANDDGDYPSMAAFLNTITPGVDNEGVKIERKIELRVPGVEIPIVGYIDIITQEGTPGDFKTSGKSWGTDKAAGELQPLFYLAALNQAGIKTTGRFKHYVFVKNKTVKTQIIETAYDVKDIFFLFRMIRSVWQAINKGVYVESPGSWKCSANFCDYWALCRGR